LDHWFVISIGHRIGYGAETTFSEHSQNHYVLKKERKSGPRRGKVRGKFLKGNHATSPSFIPSQRIRESEGKHATHKRTNNSVNHTRKHKLLRTTKSGVVQRQKRRGDGGGGGLGVSRRYGSYGRCGVALFLLKRLGASHISSWAIRCETRANSCLERRRRAHTSQVRAISHIRGETKRVKRVAPSYAH
jgi:hypothetical protein